MRGQQQGEQQERTVRMILARDLEEGGESLLVLIHQWSDLVGNLVTRSREVSLGSSASDQGDDVRAG
jgi:hypothetical protein